MVPLLMGHVSGPRRPSVCCRSLAPKVLKPSRRQLSIPHRMLNILVAQICLQSPRVMSSICKRVPASMPKHVRVSLEAELRFDPRPFDHPGEAGSGKRTRTGPVPV